MKDLFAILWMGLVVIPLALVALAIVLFFMGFLIALVLAIVGGAASIL